MGRPKGGGTRKDIRASYDEEDCDGRQHAGGEHFERLAEPLRDKSSMAHPPNSSFWDQNCSEVTDMDSDFDFFTGIV